MAKKDILIETVLGLALLGWWLTLAQLPEVSCTAKVQTGPVVTKRRPRSQRESRELCFDCLSRTCRHFEENVTLPHYVQNTARLVSLGMTNEEISTCLDITNNTVKFYVHKALRALGLETRVDLANWYRKTSEARSAEPPAESGLLVDYV